jgi:putative hydrolase of the HAD superfamily
VSRPAALLVDFGGVLTSDVFEGFRAFCGSAGLPVDSVMHAVRDPQTAPLLVAAETGAMSEQEFDLRFAAALHQRTGIVVDPDGLTSRMTGHLRPDPAMLDVVARVRGAGYHTGLVSNSLGWTAYDGYDLQALFDMIVISGHVGMRKPSRKIYTLAADRLGVAAEQCVFVDDLAQNAEAARRVGMTGIHHLHTPDTVRALEELFDVSKEIAP